MRIIDREQAIRASADIIYQNALDRTGSTAEAEYDKAEFVQTRGEAKEQTQVSDKE